MSVFFVIVFALVLLFSGISFGAIVLALVLGTVAMLLAGFVSLVFKLLPWLLLAMLGVWLWRTYQKQQAMRHNY